MSIPYKMTSGMALGTLPLAIASALLPLRQTRVPSGTASVGWDPCSVWIQYDPVYRSAVLLAFGAFVLFTVRGLRNRSGPKWLAVAGVLAVGLAIASEWWRIAAGCYSSASLVLSFIWGSAVVVMFLHHAIQPPSGTHARPPDWRLRTVAYRSVLPVFVYLALAWAILNRFRVVAYDGDNPTLAYSVIVIIQRYVAWAALALFPVAALVSLHLLIGTRRRRIRM